MITISTGKLRLLYKYILQLLLISILTLRP
jgi:hypothetical protein